MNKEKSYGTFIACLEILVFFVPFSFRIEFLIFLLLKGFLVLRTVETRFLFPLQVNLPCVY